jgi:hypothetical protein
MVKEAGKLREITATREVHVKRAMAGEGEMIVVVAHDGSTRVVEPGRIAVCDSGDQMWIGTPTEIEQAMGKRIAAGRVE